MKLTVLFFMLSTTFVFSQATQNVHGVVIDKQSEYPLPDTSVVIQINGKTYGSVTDFDGNYLIENVPIGKINISAHYKGFHKQNFTQLQLNSGKELVVNFVLLEKLESLNEVVIKAKSKRDNVTYVSTSAASFNVAQTNKYAGSLNDVSRMAMNYAGVSGNDDSRNDIIVRGNNPASLLWVIEGATIPSPNHYSTSGSSGGPVSMLNINTLSRSDFLSGAFPANFGNTTSAAFDLQFRKPNNNKTEFVGQIGFSGAELGIEGPFSKNKKSSYLLNYRYSTLALFDEMGFDLGLGTAIPKYQDVNAIVNLPSKKIGNFKLWAIAGISKIKFDNTEDNGEDNLYFTYAKSTLVKENKNVLTGFTHKYFFNKKTSSKVSFSYSNIDELVKVDTLNIADQKFNTTFDMKIITQYTNVDVKINSKINVKNKISVGINYTDFNTNLLLNNYVDGYLNTVRNSTGLASVYSNWQHRFTNDLVLNSGLRIQYFTLNKQAAFEPRVGLKYKVKNNTNISLAYGLHSNINPLLSYFTKQEVNPGIYKNRNRNLSMVKSHHFIAGIHQKLNEKLKVKAEVYYQYLFDVPISHKNSWYSIINSGFGEDGGSQIIFDELYNEGKGKNYGLDVTLEYPLKNDFYALLTGSIYKSTYLAHDNIWRNTAWNGNYMASLLTGKEFVLNKESSFSVDINLNYAGGRRTAPINLAQSQLDGETVYYQDRIFENKLDAYFRTDIKLSYKRNGKKINQEWQVDLRNVTNRKNIFSQNYNPNSNTIDTKFQTGFLPVVQYRILF